MWTTGPVRTCSYCWGPSNSQVWSVKQRDGSQRTNMCCRRINKAVPPSMLLYPNIALFLKLICPLIISYTYIKHSDHTYPFPFISSSCPEKPLPSFLPLKPFPIFPYYFFFFVIHCPMCMDLGVKQPTGTQEAHQCLLHWRWSLPVLRSSWLILAPLVR